jgi:hypothetical protein
VGVAAAKARAIELEAASKQRLSVALGFSHWFGATFGSPDGYSTPGLEVGVRPRLSWLELRLRYVLSVIPPTLPDGHRGVVGFASLGLVADKELRVGRHSLVGLAGIELALDHTDRGAGWGLGIAVGAEYLLRTGARHDHAVGLAVTAHELFYALPGDAMNLFDHSRRDAQIDISVITTVF